MNDNLGAFDSCAPGRVMYRAQASAASVLLPNTSSCALLLSVSILQLFLPNATAPYNYNFVQLQRPTVTAPTVTAMKVVSDFPWGGKALKKFLTPLPLIFSPRIWPTIFFSLYQISQFFFKKLYAYKMGK